MSKLEQLADRVEALEYSDDGEAGVDKQIWYDTGERDIWLDEVKAYVPPGSHFGDDPPPFTSSLDCAMELIPEGWTRAVDATVPKFGITVELFGPDGRCVKADSLLEPCATVAAALRARAMEDE